MCRNGRRALSVGCSLAALLSLAAPAFSQPSFRQTVVVTAAATPIELGSVTRTVTVITRDQIDGLPAYSVADVLRLTSSIDVRARGERGVQSDFAVRGANFGQMLVLVDGVRLNDAQSGHHNGDIPVPLDEVERIEVLYGPGSSLFGADAFGGTINIITREGAGTPSLEVHGGSFGLGGTRGAVGLERGPVRQRLSGSVERSSGFMYDRDFKTAIARARTSVGSRSHVSVSHLWKEFGASNFYGGNAPSREWTNQTLVAADHRFGGGAGWTIDGAASYRSHGDRFLFNQELPALSDNRHRTHAALGSVTASRRVGSSASFTAGVEGGGDWIRSSNLGDHDVARVSGFGEWRQDLGPRTQFDATLRVDRYSEFGASWSPSAGIGWSPTRIVRLRASAGHAFRVPTFTERYYSDPANLAREEVGPESAWAGEGGADLFLPGGWWAQATFFGRADQDVIDWLRPTVADRWRTYNVRDVSTRGIEAGVRKSLAGGAFAQASYTALDVEAASVSQLSKYVLDFASRSFVAAGSVSLPGAFRVAPRVEYRRRVRSTGTVNYVLIDARIARRVNRLIDLMVDGTNLLDTSYQEIAGVRMPGAAFSVSLTIATP